MLLPSNCLCTGELNLTVPSTANLGGATTLRLLGRQLFTWPGGAVAPCARFPDHHRRSAGLFRFKYDRRPIKIVVRPKDGGGGVSDKCVS